MKITSLIALAASALFLASCETGKYPGYKQADSGLYYQHHNHNEKGRKPAPGDYISMDMVYMTESDSVIYDSKKAGNPIVLMYEKPEYKGDIVEGIGMLAEGDSSSFIVSADSFFVHNVKNELPPFIPKGSFLTFHVKVNKIQTAEAMQQEQAELINKRAEIEKKQLFEYLKASNFTNVTPTESGLYYIEKVKGKGPKAENGKTVKVNYTGKLLDGTVFDTSLESAAKAANVYNPQRPYQPFELQLGTGSVIPGWEEGIAMMNQGSKGIFIIPSNLGYGNRDMGTIPPFSTLVFEVELLEVK